MRITVIGGFAPSLIPFRGPLLSTLVARGHEVTAMAADGTPAITADLARIGVDFQPLALQRAGTNPLVDLRTIATLTMQLRRQRPDAVFAYTIKPILYGLTAARAAGVERRFAMITGLGYAYLGQTTRSRRWLRRGVSLAYRGVLSGVDRLFVQNADDLRDLRTVGAVPASVPTTVVRGSGVDPDHYTVAAWPEGPPVFLFIGRLLREKGFVDFVEMARRVKLTRPDARFVAVGWVDPNPASVQHGEVDRWVAEGLIEYAGEVKDVRPFLATSHVLVLPSYREGTPRSVLEAMSTARPVIVTDVPGCRETIEDGVHGLFAPARDPDALAAAALRMLADPDGLRAMGQRARARIEQLYDSRRIAAGMADVMQL